MDRETCCDQHVKYQAGCADCKTWNKAWRDKNRQRIRDAQNARWTRLSKEINDKRRERHAENPERNRAQMRNWRTKNPERYKELLRQSYYRHHESRKQRMRNHNRNLKLEVLSHYASDFMGCICCKTTHIEFLTLDHVDDDGYIHRRELFGVNTGMAGQAIYRRLKELGFPNNPRLQILCFNCQVMKRMKETCNHEK